MPETGDPSSCGPPAGHRFVHDPDDEDSLWTTVTLPSQFSNMAYRTGSESRLGSSAASGSGSANPSRGSSTLNQFHPIDLDSDLSSLSGSRGNTPSPSLNQNNDEEEEELSRIRHNLDRATAIKIYKQVWNEYYSWEKDAVAGWFASIMQPYETWGPRSAESIKRIRDLHDKPINIENFLGRPRDYHGANNPGSNDDEETDSFVVMTFSDTESGPSSTTRHYTIPVERAPEIEPCAPYESCTPSMQNLHRRPYEPLASELLRFIPHTDDPNFDIQTYAGHSASLAWEDRDLRQVDCKCALSLFCSGFLTWPVFEISYIFLHSVSIRIKSGVDTV